MRISVVSGISKDMSLKKTMIRIFLSLILLISTLVNATSWILWNAGSNSSANSWTPFSSGYNNKSLSDNKGYARANGQYAGELRKRIMGRMNGYTESNANTYYKGQFENYGKARGKGYYENYGKKGHLGYTPSNNFFTNLKKL